MMKREHKCTMCNNNATYVSGNSELALCDECYVSMEETFEEFEDNDEDNPEHLDFHTYYAFEPVDNTPSPNKRDAKIKTSAIACRLLHDYLMGECLVSEQELDDVFHYDCDAEEFITGAHLVTIRRGIRSANSEDVNIPVQFYLLIEAITDKQMPLETMEKFKDVIAWMYKATEDFRNK